MGVGMARHTQNVLKLANLQYLWTGQNCCMEVFACSYLSMKAENGSYFFRQAQPGIPKVYQNNKFSISLDKVDIYQCLASGQATIRAANWIYYFMRVWLDMPNVSKNIKFSIFLEFFPTVPMKVYHSNLSLSLRFSHSVSQSISLSVAFPSIVGFHSCVSCLFFLLPGFTHLMVVI